MRKEKNSRTLGRFGFGARIGERFSATTEKRGLTLARFIGDDTMGDRVRVAARVDADNIAATEVIVYRVKFAALRSRLGDGEIAMLANSDDNDACGLTRLDAAGKALDAKTAESEWWALLGAPRDKRYLFFGFQPPVRHRTFLRVRNGWFECGCRVQRSLNRGDVFISDTLSVREGTDPHALLETFGDFVAKTSRPRTGRPRTIGWNSWDYYFRSFEETDLRENLDAIKTFAPKTGVVPKTIVIDDCWFTDFGDWRANGRFPSGMATAAQTIRAAGFVPGIWLAPFLVHYYTKTLLRTPEICAVPEDPDTPIEEWAFGPLRFIDPTRDEGEKFLTELFGGLKRAGFAYFKVDFLRYLVAFGKNKRFYRDALGRVEILRRGLEIIRAAIGDDAYLLTCGCPPEAAIGTADANRVGGDVSSYNSTTRVNARFLASRYWMNNRLWTADPDFLIVRCDATATDPHHNPWLICPREGSRSGAPWKNPDDVRVWATLVGMSGGELVLADHLGKLNAIGAEIIRTAIANASPDAAEPLDLMENRQPAIWFRGGERPALAVINWEEAPRQIALPSGLGPFAGSRDIWRGTEIVEKQGRLTVDLPPFGAAWFVSDVSR